MYTSGLYSITLFKHDTLNCKHIDINVTVHIPPARQVIDLDITMTVLTDIQKIQLPVPDRVRLKIKEKEIKVGDVKNLVDKSGNMRTATLCIIIMACDHRGTS